MLKQRLLRAVGLFSLVLLVCGIAGVFELRRIASPSRATPLAINVPEFAGSPPDIRDGSLLRFRSPDPLATNSSGFVVLGWRRDSLIATCQVKAEPQQEVELEFCLNDPDLGNRGYVLTIRSSSGVVRKQILDVPERDGAALQPKCSFTMSCTKDGCACVVMLPAINDLEMGKHLKFSAALYERRGLTVAAERIWDEAQNSPLLLQLDRGSCPPCLARLYPSVSRPGKKSPASVPADAEHFWEQRKDLQFYNIGFVTDDGVVGRLAEVLDPDGQVIATCATHPIGRHIVGSIAVPYSTSERFLSLDGRKVVRFCPCWQGQALLSRRSNESAKAEPIWFPKYVFSGDHFPEPQFENLARELSTCDHPRLTVRYFDNHFHQVLEADKVGRYGAIVDVWERRHYQVFATLYRLKAASNSPAVVEVADLPRRRRGEIVAMRLSSGQKDVDVYTIFDKDQAWWLGLRGRVGVPCPCDVVLPPHYDDSLKERRWPVLLFLHGGGAQDLDLLPRLVAADDFRTILKKKPEPVIVIEPFLSVQDLRWSAPLVELVLRQAESKYRIDPNRIILAGESSGGTAVWRVASQDPYLFAGALPLSSSSSDAIVGRLRSVPIWAFQYKKDFPEPVADVVKSIRAEGGRAKLTTVAGNGHLSGWAAWPRQDVWKWIIARRRIPR